LTDNPAEELKSTNDKGGGVARIGMVMDNPLPEPNPS